MMASQLRALVPPVLRPVFRPVTRAIRAVRHRVSGMRTTDRTPPPGWRYVQLILAGSRNHAFLDRHWVVGAFHLLPQRFHQPFALRLLGLSPHYWVYQWTNLYPPEYSRLQVLQAEFDRNARSRVELCDKLLKPHLLAGETVMDFGCGPGFLAKLTAAHVGQVLAVDVSRGVLACAQALNGAENLRYVRTGTSGLAAIPDHSLDLIYSFAVFQHVRKEDAAAIFAEFARVLRPGGKVLCHVILKEEGEGRFPDPSAGDWVQQRVMLRMLYYTAAEMTGVVTQAGFQNVQIMKISDYAHVNDDIGQEQLMILRRN